MQNITLPNTNISKSITDLFLKISSGMLLTSDHSTFLQEALKDIGYVLNVQRVYVFAFDGNNWKNTFSWTDPILPPFTDLLGGSNLQEVLAEDGMLKALAVGNPYILDSRDDLPDANARQVLGQHFILSLIMVPLFSEGNLTGFFGVDQCKDVPNWAANTLNTMLTIGHLLNNAINYFQALELLKNKETETQELLDLFPFPIYITNIQTHEIICYNKSLGDYFNVSDVQDKKCHQIIINSDEPCGFCKTEHLCQVGDCHIWDMHNDYINKDFKLIDRCIEWGELEKARLSISLDISDSLRMQREQVLNRESSIAKSRFLANMSHELRTPLNGIIGMTHLAIQHNQADNIAHYLDKVQRSSRKLLGIINDILDFSKMEAGKLELDQHPFSLSEICAEVEDNLHNYAKNKNLTLSHSIDSNVPETLFGDSLRFAQIMLHLVRNAIKFTEVGEVKYSLSIDTKAQNDERTIIVIEVEDSGIGISDDELKKLFVEFAQADESSSRRYGGTGLGLAIVYNLVELMGGVIFVQSQVNKGTIFNCRIPFVVYHENTIPTKDAQPDVQHSLEGISVLLAEDNEINSLIASELLMQLGCKVDCAYSGQDVLNLLEHNIYNIILMDVQMPIMDGHETTHHIRKNSCFDHLPIVALTAHVLNEEINKCYASGMQGHITKPIAPEQLYKAVSKHTKEPFTFKR